MVPTATINFFHEARAKMTNQQIFDAIEHGDVRSDLLYATGSAALQDRIDRHPILAEARLRMNTDEDFQFECGIRAMGALSAPEIPGYAHPNRTVVAAYMFLMYSWEFDLGATLIREADMANRADWSEVTDLIRNYALCSPD